MRPPSSMDLMALAWPQVRVGEALDGLARAVGLCSRLKGEMPSAPDEGSQSDMGPWITGAAEWLGLEAQPTDVGYDDLDGLIHHAAPAVFRCEAVSCSRYLVVIRQRGNRVELLAPDWSRHWVAAQEIQTALMSREEAPLRPGTEATLERAGIPEKRRARARERLIRERLSHRRYDGCWMLRLPPGSPFSRQLRRTHIPRHLIALFAAHTIDFALLILGWWMIGRGALAGHIDPGWLMAWALVLVSTVPVRVTALRLAANLAICVGGLLRERLMCGALGLSQDDVRIDGAGRHFGRVLEMEALESLALSGGLGALVGLIQILFTIPLLLIGAGGTLLAGVFVAWLLMALLLTWRDWRARDAWTEARLEMTHELVENMVGHRTRLAQLPTHLWHAPEDDVLDNYLSLSRTADRASNTVTSTITRGWMLVGVLAIAPAFVGASHGGALVAVSIGGIIVGALALRQLSLGLSQVLGAIIAWKRVKPLFDSAGEREAPALPSFALLADEERAGMSLEATDLTYHYPNRSVPVLKECSLRLRKGARVLLEGPSGGGKSTLAALLAAIRRPSSGLLLLGGLDVSTVGASRWRQRVVFVPQFHDNHVLTGTLAFNLLMGRRWPPSSDDLRLAETVCRELGLGPLLDRMPSGLQQTVGETGWQLSHGERSRVFLARALLQEPNVLILDESFASLDPETLQCSFDCAMARSETLVVIAHP